MLVGIKADFGGMRDRDTVVPLSLAEGTTHEVERRRSRGRRGRQTLRCRGQAALASRRPDRHLRPEVQIPRNAPVQDQVTTPAATRS